MSKTYHSSNRWALTGLFKRINLGDDPKTLLSEAAHLVEKVDSDDITAAQKAMVDEGYPAQRVEKIASVFVMLGLQKKQTDRSDKLPDNHILQKISAEHTMARCYLEDLTQITEEIDGMETMSDVSAEFRRLARIAQYLFRFKRHFEREEDVIFPYLVKLGWKGLCGGDTEEHKKITKDIDDLLTLVASAEAVKLEKFKAYLKKTVDHFVPMMRNHLEYEDELLWPIAMVIVENADVWERIKALCDAFDY